LVHNKYSLKPGKALDIACGRGRNSFFLASMGFHITATDIADVALESIKSHIAREYHQIEIMEGDLDEPDFLLSAAPFDSIICINFKPGNNLLQLIPQLLSENGVFLWCSFNDLQAIINDFPLEKALHKNEFIEQWPTMRLLKYERFTDETGQRDGYIFQKNPDIVP
jgi:SAM-dependent methyltransferase